MSMRYVPGSSRRRILAEAVAAGDGLWLAGLDGAGGQLEHLGSAGAVCCGVVDDVVDDRAHCLAVGVDRLNAMVTSPPIGRRAGVPVKVSRDTALAVSKPSRVRPPGRRA
jgi:hypothetical protein